MTRFTKHVEPTGRPLPAFTSTTDRLAPAVVFAAEGADLLRLTVVDGELTITGGSERHTSTVRIAVTDAVDGEAIVRTDHLVQQLRRLPDAPITVEPYDGQLELTCNHHGTKIRVMRSVRLPDPLPAAEGRWEVDSRHLAKMITSARTVYVPVDQLHLAIDPHGLRVWSQSGQRVASAHHRAPIHDSPEAVSVPAELAVAAARRFAADDGAVQLGWTPEVATLRCAAATISIALTGDVAEFPVATSEPDARAVLQPRRLIGVLNRARLLALPEFVAPVTLSVGDLTVAVTRSGAEADTIDRIHTEGEASVRADAVDLLAASRAFDPWGEISLGMRSDGSATFTAANADGRTHEFTVLAPAAM